MRSGPYANFSQLTIGRAASVRGSASVLCGLNGPDYLTRNEEVKRRNGAGDYAVTRLPGVSGSGPLTGPPVISCRTATLAAGAKRQRMS